VVSSIIIVLIVISRAYAWGDTWEQDLIACGSVVMFSNVLNIVTPFKFIGVSCNLLSRPPITPPVYLATRCDLSLCGTFSASSTYYYYYYYYYYYINNINNSNIIINNKNNNNNNNNNQAFH